MALIDTQKMRLYRQSARRRAEQKEHELQRRHQWALSIAEEAAEMGFWAIHVDTMFWSLLIGFLFIFFFSRAAKSATAGTPNGLINFVEWVEFWVFEILKFLL